MMLLSKHPSSFRDKSGYVFKKNNILYRTVNKSFSEDFDFFMSSGLYGELVKKNLLINHEELLGNIDDFGRDVYKVLMPRVIPFISYPYEWSQSMLLDAGLLTLEIEKIALNYGMSLKDASAFNIQFVGNNPIFIDSLSFEKIKQGKPWVAYSQFCRHFLAPLALMKHKNVKLGKLQTLFLDGIDIDLAVRLLPYKSFINFHLFFNLFLHNFGQKKLEKIQNNKENRNFKKSDLLNLIESLKNAVLALSEKNNKSFWTGYYSDNNYSNESASKKIEIITLLLSKIKPKILADIGANTGLFSRISARLSKYVISVDIDSAAVNEGYKTGKKDKIENILNLVIDITNPSPAIGWKNKERESFLSRLNADCILALALLHHLYFACNLSFDEIAGFFYKITNYLIIEYVPFSDSQVKKIIGFKSIDPQDYTEENFIKSFSRYFRVVNKFEIPKSLRSIFLFRKKNV